MGRSNGSQMPADSKRGERDFSGITRKEPEESLYKEPPEQLFVAPVFHGIHWPV